MLISSKSQDYSDAILSSYIEEFCQWQFLNYTFLVGYAKMLNMKILVGIVQDGKNDANRWLRQFADVYANWLGEYIFPGSLNIDTGQRFDWHDAALCVNMLEAPPPLKINVE